MLPNSKIDGITLKKMMITAASNLEQTKEEINAITEPQTELLFESTGLIIYVN